MLQEQKQREIQILYRSVSWISVIAIQFFPTDYNVIVDPPLVCAYTGRRRCNTDEKRPAQTTSREVMSCHVHGPVPMGV